ncbi:MAG: chitobiase/beta-hexosaminidase C-terminal domain-containing protein, partial [Kiritimatiellae bacterium]|nr:chitobiase/beta-hexosaminidase C-terminal domain-containing protein [Kiritimatiellia bacterium]
MHRLKKLVVVAALAAVAVAVTSQAATVVKPTFSQAHGFYSSSFSVKISSATSGATIRYTTDCSKPTASNGTVLANGGSVTINRTTCLRACAAKSGMTTSYPFTQTYIFVNDVVTLSTQPAGYPSLWRVESGETKDADYEMDPNVVNDSLYSSRIKNDLKAIPSLSLVVPKDVMFGSGTRVGLYSFGGYYGGQNTLEVECSAELITPGRSGFQIDCGLKGHSGTNHKRSMRLLFKSNYGGPAKLNYPLFEDTPFKNTGSVNSFGKIFMRMGHNDSWCAFWLDQTALRNRTYLRDPWIRLSMLEMNGFGTRGLPMHLYINGMYWGLYDAQERPDARMAADYQGGSKSDWYAVNHAGTVSGSATRYNYLHDTLVPGGGFANASKYNTVKQYLDVERYADYVMLGWYAGTSDWGNNNFYAVCRNNPAGPVQYMVWDQDWSLTAGTNPGAWVNPAFLTDNSKLCKLWRALDDNTDFMMMFADRVYKHCFNGGPLTDANAKARWDKLVNYLDSGVVCESARWGDRCEDNGKAVGLLKHSHWVTACGDVRNNMLNGNANRFISALRAKNYYPSINPPAYSTHGGTVAAGFKLTISRSSSGTIYYRTDGADPRVAGGGINSGSSASTASAVLTLNSTTTVQARLKNGSSWSALADATFTVTGGPTIPAAPGTLAASAQSASQIRVSWTDNSSNEAGFKLERSLNGSTWSQITQPGA